MKPKIQKNSFIIKNLSEEEKTQKIFEPFSEIEKFLHETNRLQIMAQLYALNQADMIYLKNTLGLSWGNLSFHSSMLEEKGLISVKKQFIGKKPYTLLQITEEGKHQFEEYRMKMQQFLK